MCVIPPCDFISPLENLWRGQRHSIYVLLHYVVRSANNRSKPETRQTSVTLVIDEDAELTKGYRRDPK